MARPIAPVDLIRRQVVLEEHDPLPDGRGAVIVRRVVHGETYRSHLYLVVFAEGRGVPGGGRAVGIPAARQSPPRGSSPRAPFATRIPACRPTGGASPSCARSRTTRIDRPRP